MSETEGLFCYHQLAGNDTASLRDDHD